MSLLFVGLHLNLMSIGYVKSSILWNFGLSLRDNTEWHWIMVCLMWLSPVWMIKESSWTNILLFSRHADSHCELCFVKVINVLSCVCRWMMWWWLVMILWYLVHQILHSRYLVLPTELCKCLSLSGCLLSFGIESATCLTLMEMGSLEIHDYFGFFCWPASSCIWLQHGSVIQEIWWVVGMLISAVWYLDLQTWRAYANDGECTRTFRQHSDYVTSLASAHQVGHCISLFGCVGTWVTLPITQHGLIGVSQTSS